MMKDNFLYIEDIKNSIEWIFDVHLRGITYQDFIDNMTVQDAVVKRMEVIGEAMNRLSDDFILEHNELPFREAISMRNFLIHEYDMVDVDELWKTVHTDLPKLKNLVDGILKKPRNVK